MKLRSGKIMGETIDVAAICGALGIEHSQELSEADILEKIKALSSSSQSSSSTDRETNAQPNGSSTRFPRMNFEEYKVQLPVFSGMEPSEDPFEFIEMVADMQNAKNISEEDMLMFVLPSMLKGEARKWYAFKSPFQKMEVFKKSFLQQFYNFAWEDELEQQIQQSYQLPNQSLSSFVRHVALLFSRLPSAPEVDKQIQFIISRSHPAFRTFLYDKTISSLRELEEHS